MERNYLLFCLDFGCLSGLVLLLPSMTWMPLIEISTINFSCCFVTLDISTSNELQATIVVESLFHKGNIRSFGNNISCYLLHSSSFHHHDKSEIKGFSARNAYTHNQLINNLNLFLFDAIVRLCTYIRLVIII